MSELNKKFERIMLVDDDYVNNFLNEEIIREMDIAENIIVHTSGNEALQWLSENTNGQMNPVDLIFLDINMPGLDGFEFLSHLRSLKKLKELPVVFLTTSDNVRDKDKARDMKVWGYINKPLSREKINICLQDWSEKACG
jgi:CheY-like chemotaxis protein